MKENGKMTPIVTTMVYQILVVPSRPIVTTVKKLTLRVVMMKTTMAELHHSKSDDDCDFLNDNQQKFMRKIKLAVASQIREAFGEMQVITINKYIEKIIENIYSHVCYHLLFCLTFQRA